MTFDLTRDERAYEMLKWQSLAPLGPFDPDYPYFEVWKTYSDKALDDYDKQQQPKEKNREGVARTEARTPTSTDGPSPIRRVPDPKRTGEGLAFLDEKQGLPSRRTRGRKRC